MFAFPRHAGPVVIVGAFALFGLMLVQGPSGFTDSPPEASLINFRVLCMSVYSINRICNGSLTLLSLPCAQALQQNALFQPDTPVDMPTVDMALLRQRLHKYVSV